eukprot:g76978.t1
MAIFDLRRTREAFIQAFTKDNFPTCAFGDPERTRMYLLEYLRPCTPEEVQEAEPCDATLAVAKVQSPLRNLCFVPRVLFPLYIFRCNYTVQSKRTVACDSFPGNDYLSSNSSLPKTSPVFHRAFQSVNSIRNGTFLLLFTNVREQCKPYTGMVQESLETSR